MGIPYARQSISAEDIHTVVETLTSDWLTQGPAIERFEQAVAASCGAAFAVATCNATAALHLACLVLGLQPHQRLWTTPTTFVASANCGRYCGAEVDFVDIDPRSWNMSPERLAEKLARARAEGCLPNVVVPVDFGGAPCEYRRIAELCRAHGCAILADASHSIGGSYNQRRLGNGEFADLTVFSFHPVKIITTGEGGMILTNNKAHYERLKLLRSHGITRNPETMTQTPDGPWFYQQIELGFNYRMTDIQAALGYSQLQRLDSFVQRRRELAERYRRGLAGLPLVLPMAEAHHDSAYHLYVVRVQTEHPSRKDVFAHLQQAGIAPNVHYAPVHLHPYYRHLGFRDGDFPEAELFYRQAISLPMYAGLSDADQDRVIAALQSVF
jgi:UDP-4-amino-4,6-dideoxy-N-acetyl-beta-L-altrosamine transaminase